MAARHSSIVGSRLGPTLGGRGGGGEEPERQPAARGWVGRWGFEEPGPAGSIATVCRQQLTAPGAGLAATESSA